MNFVLQNSGGLERGPSPPYKMSDVVKEVLRLKEKRNAIILAHNYQRPEIQDIADFLGDSLNLARKACETNAEVIVFCGVDFMAETASILNPHKRVLIPDPSSICPMARMLSADEVERAKREYPETDVVLYVNSSAECKAHSNCVCTSSNPDKIVNAMKSSKVIFGPDLNLTHYVENRTTKEVIPIPRYGMCPTHHQISKDDIETALKDHPDAELVVHPETIPEVQEMADEIASTEGILDYCRSSEKNEFIVGTENGILHRLRKEIPEKRFYHVSELMVCPPMKMITLRKVRDSLRDMKYEVNIPQDIADRARKSIQCMLDVLGR